MRVLCVTSYYKPAYVYGGPARSVPALCEGLVACGARVTVLTTQASGSTGLLDVPTTHPVRVDGVKVHYFALQPHVRKLAPRYFYAPKLGHALAKAVHRFDIVYCVGSWTYPFYAGAKAALLRDTPYVLSPRGSYMDWAMEQGSLKKRLYLALVERRLVNGADAIHVTSSLEQKQIEHWRFRAPVVCLPNGLDLMPFQAAHQGGKWRHMLGVPEHGTLSLFVGRLHREKRIALVVEAFALLAERVPTAHLLFVGPDQDGSGECAQQRVRELGLSDRVHFAGLVDGAEVSAIYREADLLLLLSHRENFGMVAVEAMAAGLPVLLSSEVGLASIVDSARAGLVVSATCEEVAQAWAGFLLRPQATKAMGVRGRALVVQRFTSEAVASRMLALFDRVIRGDSLADTASCLGRHDG